MAHFLLGVALAGMKHYSRAAEAHRVALSLNPNFPQAHFRLSLLLKRLKDPVGSAEHLRLARELRAAARRGRRAKSLAVAATSADSTIRVAPEAPKTAAAVDLPELGDDVVVVSGLPRSGTSMIMQMLAAGGVPVLTDGRRAADDDNPRGYYEYEPVKNLYRDPAWVREAGGKAVKIVAPLLPYLPQGPAYRIIFIERELDEVLASQTDMLIRHGEPVEDSPAHRSRLRTEYARQIDRVKELLASRPETRTLFLHRDDVFGGPDAAADRINRFLGGKYNSAAMAAQVNPALNRKRVAGMGG
jgi:hypothetical protein